MPKWAVAWPWGPDWAGWEQNKNLFGWDGRKTELNAAFVGK